MKPEFMAVRMQKRIAILSIFLFTISPHSQGAAVLAEQVRLESGAVRGTPRNAQGVLVFKGIPYAAAPVGELRWRAPMPAASWEGIRDATKVTARCWVNVPETGLGGRVQDAAPQSEDCLYLNIWTAARSANELRPVMVWIHGGGFQFGTGSDPRTDGSLLARKGVIVVSLNYRLGVFGFFGFPKLRSEGRLAGNFGILDQIAALQWVQANIEKFGGDPKNVTIFGESVGSQSVSLLMGSPLAKGLFQKGIGQSGSSLQVLPTLVEMGIRCSAYAGALGAKSVEELRAMPADRINTAATYDFVGGAPLVFAPAIDGYVIPTQLVEIFRSGRQNDVPLIAGYDKREDFPFPNEVLPHDTSVNFRAAAQRVFGAQKMQEFNALYPNEPDSATKATAEDLFGDIAQRAETWRWLVMQSQTGKSSIYGYVFSYESPYSPVASHAAEVPFVFGNLVPQFFAPQAPASSEKDQRLADQMTSYWANFAASGNPNGAGLPQWQEFRAKGSMLQIEEGGQMNSSPLTDLQLARFKFLDDFLVSASMGHP